MNEYAQAMLDFAQQQLGERYQHAAHGPDKWDCVGLVVGSGRAAGLDTSVVPASWTVRNLKSWAQKHGRLRLATSGYTPKPGDIFLWGDAKSASHAPALGAGHTGLVEEAPSAAHPNGWAISAYNPKRGVCEHRLVPKPSTGLALYGFVELDYPVAPPFEQPEPPADDGAIDPPTPVDFAKLYAELRANADAAIALLTQQEV